MGDLRLYLGGWSIWSQLGSLTCFRLIWLMPKAGWSLLRWPGWFGLAPYGSPSYGGNVLKTGHRVRVKVSPVIQVLFKPVHVYCWWTFHWLKQMTSASDCPASPHALVPSPPCCSHPFLLQTPTQTGFLHIVNLSEILFFPYGSWVIATASANPRSCVTYLLMKVENNKWLSTRLVWPIRSPSKLL